MQVSVCVWREGVWWCVSPSTQGGHICSNVGPHSYLQSAAQCGGVPGPASKGLNEVTYHMVHVVHSQLALQKGAPVVRGGEGKVES